MKSQGALLSLLSFVGLVLGPILTSASPNCAESLVSAASAPKILVLDPRWTPKIGLEIVRQTNQSGAILSLERYSGKHAQKHPEYYFAPFQKIWRLDQFPESLQEALGVLYRLTRNGLVTNERTGIVFPIALSELSRDAVDRGFNPTEKDPLEIGLVHARFKNRKEEFIFFSSKETMQIDGNAALSAGDLMEELALKQKTKVTKIDFFHTHPDKFQSPTSVKFLNSRADLIAFTEWKGWAQDRWESSVEPKAAAEVRFFALAKESDGDLWISQIVDQPVKKSNRHREMKPR